ncbi:MAG: hypothetical protein LBC70_10355 [Chitinispirillales bacterium]|nr:hypothetical protein [Chitinispirillales bacterium]
MEKKKGLVKYFWQITYAHTISYFIAGVIAMTIFNYREWWSSEYISAFYRDIDSPIMALGGGVLQIFRGFIVALILLPLRKTFFEEKYGLLKLALIVFGFSIVSTYGAVITSFEGLIYLKVPLIYHIKGIPEGLIWLSLFIGILFISIKYSHKKVVTILPIIIVALIVLMSIVGYLDAMGYLNT